MAWRRVFALAAAAMVGSSSGSAWAQEAGLFGPVQRDDFHFQVGFGWGGGPNSNGLLHNMELGHTFEGGFTLAYQHAFVMSSVLDEPVGSDLFGGHLLLLAVPVGVPELVVKMAFGLGENVDQRDGFDPHFGAGMTQGIELSYPFWPTSGITLQGLLIHCYTVDVGYQVAGGGALAYTWF